MIRRLHAKNYGCLKDVVTPELTPLHAFIGPNDSGKSTLLKAASLCGHAVSDLDLTDPQRLRDESKLLLAPFGGPLASFASGPEPSASIFLETGVADGFVFEAVAGGYRQEFRGGPPRPLDRLREERNLDLSYRSRATPGTDSYRLRTRVQRALLARSLRLDPDALRAPSELITGPVDFRSDRGHGLAGVLDLIVSRGDDGWRRIKEEVFRLFPTIRRIGLRNVPNWQDLGGEVGERRVKKIVEIELNDKSVVAADEMSEGLLYYLGFLAAQNLDATGVLLVEEPENGLHPSRIADVARVLRAIAEGGTQVLMATHSPLVINELQPEEVTLVTRNPELGTQLTPLSGTKNFEERSKIYALGELWLSYADGETEAELVGKPA